jgi:hypothetical protein
MICTGGCETELELRGRLEYEVATGELHTDLTCHVLVFGKLLRLRAQIKNARAIVEECRSKWFSEEGKVALALIDQVLADKD